jgi:DNA-binding SARP family transcriptional activator
MPGSLDTERVHAGVRLFGGVEIHGPAGSTSFAGAKQRAIAARLAVDAGRPVSAEQLVDSVWGDDLPATVRASVQVHISQIRRALSEIGLAEVIVTKPSGYVLDIDPEAVDVRRFQRIAALARQAHDRSEHAHALKLAEQAFELWRGQPLAGIGQAPFAESVTASLDDVRLDVVANATLDSIATGRHDAMLPLVETLVAEHPYREPLWASLARLLYAQGRQADALDRLTTLRRILLEELGLDPSPAVAELERQILDHDQALVSTGTKRRSAADNSTSNLPLMRPMIGRDALIAEVVDRLAHDRVVTLTGPGGVGKTSIAVHAAVAFGAKCRDGTCFVDLSSIASGQDPLVPLISAVGMVTATNTVAADDVLELLRGRQQLLVLDNCEHVIDASAELVSAIAASTGVRVLVTSREPLAIVDEVVIDVPPLSTADGTESSCAAHRGCSTVSRRMITTPRT